MEADAFEPVEAECCICGAEVTGEKEPWEALDWESLGRAMQASGWVCGGCGAVLCGKVHKKEVQNTSWTTGYSKSPCPRCGEPLIEGFVVIAPAKESRNDIVARFSEKAEQRMAEGSPGLEAESATGPGDEPSAAAPERWNTQPVRDGTVTLVCPGCGTEQSCNASVFSGKGAPDVEGVTNTGNYVIGGGGARTFVAFAIGAAVFWLVHVAVFGTELVGGVALFVPVAPAVIAFALTKFLLGLIAVGVSGLPILEISCTECGGTIRFATDGDSIALPVDEAGA